MGLLCPWGCVQALGESDEKWVAMGMRGPASTPGALGIRGTHCQGRGLNRLAWIALPGVGVVGAGTQPGILKSGVGWAQSPWPLVLHFRVA